jgi:hypothetical protein
MSRDRARSQAATLLLVLRPAVLVASASALAGTVTRAGGRQAAAAASQSQCGNGLDDDGDGVPDSREAGCFVTPGTEADVKIATRTTVGPNGRSRPCRLALFALVRERPRQFLPTATFPFVRASIAVRGLSGRAAGFRGTRQARLRGGVFTTALRNLRAGRYRVTGRYPGDQWRQPSQRNAFFTVACP